MTTSNTAFPDRGSGIAKGNTLNSTLGVVQDLNRSSCTSEYVSSYATNRAALQL